MYPNPGRGTRPNIFPKQRGGGPPSGGPSPPFQSGTYFEAYSTTSWVMDIVGLFTVIFAVNPGMS